MTIYNPPLRDMQFVLHELLNVSADLADMPSYAEIDAATINAVLEQGGKFAAEVLLALNANGDAQGCQFDAATHQVKTPDGFAAAYQQYCAAGWPALACATEFGGQGLPLVVNQCFYEMLNSANQAWAMYPALSYGAFDALHANASAAQKAIYLPPLASGRWSGTMCLTEPHCGTDLGLIRSKAVAQTDDSYLLTGSKIFISAGEHDLTENIVHLVLARLPDAPAGSRGLSLFIVPKYLPNADGSLGARNRVLATALEQKMGIHGNATVQLEFDAATAWLVGAPHNGMRAMFKMMNAARLGVGNQSLGLTEVAWQNAAAWAHQRLQMRSLSGAKAKDKPADPIIVHPDVRHMLLGAKAYAEAARALLCFSSMLLEKEQHHSNQQERSDAGELLAWLTPVVKAFISDNAHLATNACLQVFGGHGYIRDTGIEQIVRDNRVNLIYEGTNTIQSLDLLGRKVLGNQGASLKKFARLISALVQEEGVNEKMDQFISPLAKLGQQMSRISTEIGFQARQNPDVVGAAAVDYLRLTGHLVFAYLWARMAQVAQQKIDAGSTDAFYLAKLQTARFYFAKLFPETESLLLRLRAGTAVLMDTDAALAL